MSNTRELNIEAVRDVEAREEQREERREARLHAKLNTTVALFSFLAMLVGGLCVFWARLAVIEDHVAASKIAQEKQQAQLDAIQRDGVDTRADVRWLVRHLDTKK